MSYPIRILTPEGPVFEHEAIDAVQVTGYKGSMGILTGHAPMISALLMGPAKVTVDGKDQWFVFGEGTLEVRPPNVVMLVDFAEKAQSYEDAKRIAAGDSE